MTSFSSLLSSIGDKPQAPRPASASAPKPASTAQPDRKSNGATDRFKLTPNNAAAGVKRRSEDPDTGSKQKLAKAGQDDVPNRPTAPTSRFQLSAKPGVAEKSSSPVAQRPSAIGKSSGNPQRPMPKQPPKPAVPGASTLGAAVASSAKPRGFAAQLARAKEAAEAAKAQGGGGIQHKAAEKLTRREREKLREKQLAKETAAKKGQHGTIDRSRSGTPLGAGKSATAQKVQELSYKGTMKTAAEKQPERQPLMYRGTMRPAGSQPKPPPKKGMPQDKYGGYASWSDLDDAEDQDDGYYDDSDDDMEGGFDDLEEEETMALKAARKEDQEALAEEERLKKEKLERKKKLMALSKNAAVKKRF